jgi:hypothetical protein
MAHLSFCPRPPISREEWLARRESFKIPNTPSFTAPGGSRVSDLCGIGYNSVQKTRAIITGRRDESPPPAAFVDHGTRYEPYALAYLRYLYGPKGLCIKPDVTRAFRPQPDTLPYCMVSGTPDGLICDDLRAVGIVEVKCPFKRTIEDVASYRDNYPFAIHPSYIPQLETYLRIWQLTSGVFAFFFVHTAQMRALCSLPLDEFEQAIPQHADILAANTLLLPYTRCDSLWQWMCERVDFFYYAIMNNIEFKRGFNGVMSKKDALAFVIGLLKDHEAAVLVAHETEAAPPDQTLLAAELGQ